MIPQKLLENSMKEAKRKFSGKDKIKTETSVKKWTLEADFIFHAPTIPDDIKEATGLHVAAQKAYTRFNF